MLTHDEAQNLIDRIFEEQALALGGMVAVHEVADDLVWKLIENMDVIRGRVIRRLKERESAEELNLKPHPAIAEFLSLMGRGW